MRFTTAIWLLFVIIPIGVAAEEDFLKFETRVLDPHVGDVCYAVTLADVDGDGKQDVVAVTENSVLWYRNPDWTRRVIIEDQTPRDNVCIEAHDITGDGRIDFALGAGWTRAGSVHWLTRPQSEPTEGANGESADQRWQVHLIDEHRWVHRMRFADVLGTGRPQLVMSPLNATEGDGVLLTAYEVPADPVKDRWRPVVMDDSLNRLHNHWHVDLDGSGVIDTLTASREGVNLIRRKNDGWERTLLGRGAEADEPDMRGAGEVKTGRLRDGTMFIVTVEPMHGEKLVVYLPPGDGDTLWQRHVIADGFRRGHALWTADLNGDGGDEIVFGHSDTPETFGVIVYRVADDSGARWTEQVVDAGGMATEDLVVGDLTGNGRPDIVAGGRATRNLKLYINLE